MGFDELSPNGNDSVLTGQFPFALSLSKGHLINLAHEPPDGRRDPAPAPDSTSATCPFDVPWWNE